MIQLYQFFHYWLSNFSVIFDAIIEIKIVVVLKKINQQKNTLNTSYI